MITAISSISIAREFSITPGPRYKSEGDFSGELFRETILLPRFQEALASGSRLHIDLDGAEGYSTSFLEEAFGGLARCLRSSASVLEVLDLTSSDEPYLVDEIKAYIIEALD